MRRRYITRALVERYGPTEDCGACFGKTQQHSERCRARFDLLCAREDGPVEVRAQEGMQTPSDPAAPNLVSTSAATQEGKVDTHSMETEDNKPAVSSQPHALATPIEPSVTGNDKTMEQEVPERKRQRAVAGLSVCSLLTTIDDISFHEIPVNYVATHEIDHRPVYDHKTGERLPPHLVKVGRQTEHDARIRHQLFGRVPITKARGKKVRCQWLDEMKEGVKGSFVRSRLVAMEVAHGARLIHSLALLHSSISKSSSRELRRSRTCEDNTHVSWHYTTHQRCVLAYTVASERADCNVSASW